MAGQTRQSNWHGTAALNRNWKEPVRTLESTKKARPEYTTIECHEYCDHTDVFHEKISVLADFVRQAQHCVAYTGAGLSVSSGLDDYASDRASTQQRGSGAAAQPNDGHRALVALYQANCLQAVVNQNHDGLLQKAGFPQHCVNEIHGSWFDPSNPGGNMLREDLFENLLDHQNRVDLCLALGTSLSGLNADRLAQSAATRTPGLVICNLQCTQLDALCTLRIFAPLDRVLSKLLDQLALSLHPPYTLVWNSNNNNIYHLPYDPITGERTLDKSRSCRLDMNVGSRFRIVRGSFANCNGEVVEDPQSGGHWRLRIYQVIDPDTILTDEHWLGSWWLTAVQQGQVPLLPIVPPLVDINNDHGLLGNNTAVDRGSTASNTMEE